MKRKTIFAIGLALLVLVTLPMLAGYWECDDIPGCAPFNRGCSGDVMYHNGCFMYCKTGSTTTPAISCHWVVVEKPAPAVE